MLPLDKLKNWPNRQGLKRFEQLMLIIAVLGGGPVSLAEIREMGKRAGMSIPKAWNLADTLAKTGDLVIKTSNGWELTDSGKQHLIGLGLESNASPVKTVSHDLRTQLIKIKNQDTKDFIEEAVKCCEYGLWRSAIVTSWIGAVHLLYEYVVTNKLPEFNTEAKRINSKWKDVKTIDELAHSLGEKDFLDRLENISVISNSHKKELITCLGQRNSCGHPNNFKPLQNAVAHHIEALLSIVYEPFGK